jgi:hypothetical protein
MSWIVDNSTAYCSMLRGHSGSAAIDELLRLWIFSGIPLPIAVALMPSAHQPADALSRGAVGTVTRADTAWRHTKAVLVPWRIPNQF